MAESEPWASMTGCIDFAVVHQKTVRMRALPAWVGVGGKARMGHSNGGLIVGAAQIVVEQPKLVDQQHTLIDDGAGREGDNIGILGAGLLEYAPDDVELAVKFQTCCAAGGSCDEGLPNGWHGGRRACPDPLRMHRYLAPSEKVHPLLLHHQLEHLHALTAQQHVLRQEKHADAVAARVSKGDANACGCLGKEFV